MDPQKLTKISDTAIGDTGAGIELSLIREDGSTFHFRAYKHELHHLIVTLTKMAREAARIRTGGRNIPISGPSEYDDLPVTQVGVGISLDQKSLFLLLRFFDFDLSYRVDHKELKSIANSFVEMVKALEAPTDRAH